jgi:ribosomal protein S18 acetylase RimI-like enzyme
MGDGTHVAVLFADRLEGALLTPRPYRDASDWEAMRRILIEGGAAEAEAIFVWAEERLAALVRAGGGDSISTFWIFETDEWRVPFLERHGFVHKSTDPHFVRSLAGPIPAPSLPEGFSVRPSAGEVEAESRARASYAAFQSKWEWGRYMQRRLTFMRSPVYDDERDLVVAAPDGRIASFCIIWFDPVNRVGLFEPVGTHPDFQRRGLGKALLHFALRRMQVAGMETAIVGTNEGNEAATRLYESVGFRLANHLRLYSKAIERQRPSRSARSRRSQ